MSAARYLALLAVTFVGLLALAAIDAWAQAGAPTKHGYYTCSYVAGKIRFGSAVASPKLVVVSGSNAMAGIDMASLTGALSVRGFNFGLAASFGPGFQSFEASKILKRGDAALMPLEYLAYDYSTPQDSLVDAVYSCGMDYWKTLDWREKLFFVMAAKPFRLFDSLHFRSNARAMREVAAEAAEDMDAFGQPASQGQPMRAAAVEPDVSRHTPIAIHFDPDSPGARAIEKFVAWAKAHGVTVFATWPNTLYYPQYARYPAFGQIRDFYRRLGVNVVGGPKDAMFDASLMGDTIYHLNREGTRIRTARLIDDLRNDPAFMAWQRTARDSIPAQ